MMKRELFSAERKKVSILTSLNVSSLVVDRLGDQARGKTTAITCFLLDFVA